MFLKGIYAYVIQRVQSEFGEMYHYITWSPVNPLQWMGAVVMTGPTAHKKTKQKKNLNPHKSSPSINI